MKIIELDLKEDGKKYFCKDINEIFEVEKGNLIASIKNYCMAELLELDFEEVKETKNPYERVNNDERYYFVSERGVENFKEFTECSDNELFNSSNYFNNKNYAEYVAFKETLMRKLDRFAWEHNEIDINWRDSCSAKYYIAFDNTYNELSIDCNCTYQSNNIYFTSREIAAKAIEEFKDDLIKLYTWRFDV